jgi:hypothetical protein
LADGAGCDGVIASDHQDADPGMLTFGDRISSLCAGRIGHAD